MVPMRVVDVIRLRISVVHLYRHGHYSTRMPALLICRTLVYRVLVSVLNVAQKLFISRDVLLRYVSLSNED